MWKTFSMLRVFLLTLRESRYTKALSRPWRRVVRRGRVVTSALCSVAASSYRADNATLITCRTKYRLFSLLGHQRMRSPRFLANS